MLVHHTNFFNNAIKRLQGLLTDAKKRASEAKAKLSKEMPMFKERLIKVGEWSKSTEDKLQVSLIKHEKREKMLEGKVAKLKDCLALKSKALRLEVVNLKGKILEVWERSSRLVEEYLASDRS
ncbi:hypothetical protein COCNU_08G005400 [Cocos nucifera]|uniref:Uncharacterized protein n=1 Tax=Cocos nucifera TaxID=13894 RepID=A0A8K0IH91_COCNU|nr:hypothetical protein COCNU_08G005400 [Cocos nucifera]